MVLCFFSSLTLRISHRSSMGFFWIVREVPSLVVYYEQLLTVTYWLLNAYLDIYILRTNKKTENIKSNSKCSYLFLKTIFRLYFFLYFLKLSDSFYIVLIGINKHYYFRQIISYSYTVKSVVSSGLSLT